MFYLTLESDSFYLSWMFLFIPRWEKAVISWVACTHTWLIEQVIKFYGLRKGRATCWKCANFGCYAFGHRIDEEFGLGRLCLVDDKIVMEMWLSVARYILKNREKNLMKAVLEWLLIIFIRIRLIVTRYLATEHCLKFLLLYTHPQRVFILYCYVNIITLTWRC